MRRPDPEEFDRFQDWAEGTISILTIAPEVDGALELISHVRRRYPTVVSIGHHLASRETIARAVDAGATLVTHLGNGCPNLLPRHDNILIHQLANESLTIGLVTDGNHLPGDFVVGRAPFQRPGQGVRRLRLSTDRRVSARRL